MSAPTKMDVDQGAEEKFTLNVKTEAAAVRLEFKEEEEDTKLAQHPPHTRRRVVFVGVVVPRLAEVRRRQADEAKEDYKKLALLKNPKVKKHAAIALLPQTVKDRLKPIGLDIQDQYFTLDQAARETVVSRLFMATVYGGNMEQNFPRPAPKFLAVHGMDDFMYLPSAYQPEAPQLPGAPGLWLRPMPGGGGGPVRPLAQPKRVFVQAVPVGGRAPSRYQYMWMYSVRPADPPHLSVAEYAAHAPQFRSKWAAGIIEMGWGARMLARILLRKELGREPTDGEVDGTAKLRREKCKEITPEEIKDAYFQGKERMGVWTMKCVGYDNDFQRALSEQFFEGWTPPPRPQKKKRADRKVKKAQTTRVSAVKTKTTARKSRSQKQKREDAPDSDNKSESSDGLEYVDPTAVSQKNKFVELMDEEAAPPPKSRKRKRTETKERT